MTNQTVSSARSFRRLPALVAVIGGIAFSLLFLLAHLVQPSVDPSWQPPSELALGASGWVMIVAFLVLGLGCIGLVLALAGQVKTWPGRIGLIALFLAALGCFVGGVFPADPTSTPAGEGTLVGAIHSAGPVLLDGIPVAAVLLAIVLPRHGDRLWRRLRSILILGAVLTVGAAVVLTVSMGVMMPETGQLGPDVLIGWQGRALLLANAVWVAGVGLSALWVARYRETSSQPSVRTKDAVRGGHR